MREHSLCDRAAKRKNHETHVLAEPLRSPAHGVIAPLHQLVGDNRRVGGQQRCECEYDDF
jgi:hypothetical protein